jgi:hypothetical protein
MRVMNVRCTRMQADGLAAVVAAEREAERAWWRAERASVAEQADEQEWTASQLARALDAVQARHEQMRAAGELRGTRTAVVLPVLRAVLAERGWAGRRWKPVPPTRRGRPRGTHDEAFDARVTLYLPDDDAELLVRACHWVSEPIQAELERWYDRFGDHWRGVLHDPRPRFVGVGPSPADLRARSKLTGQVQTTGRVLREVIDRAVAGKVAT